MASGAHNNIHIARSGIRMRGRGGFTLLEVIVAVAILTLVFLAILLELFAVVKQNRLTALEVTATNVMRRQLEEVLAAAGDNQKTAKGAAKGVILYLNAIRNRVAGQQADYPVRVTLNATNAVDPATNQPPGTIMYEFVVPEPGAASRDLTAGNNGEENAYDRARGTMTVYLRENAVPPGFSSWLNLSAGAGAGTASGLNGFDMNGDGDTNTDFMFLTQPGVGGTDLFADNSLFSLPVELRVDFYESVEAKNANRFFYTTARYRVINDEALIGFN